VCVFDVKPGNSRHAGLLDGQYMAEKAGEMYQTRWVGASTKSEQSGFAMCMGEAKLLPD
jgi:hypothetical protein